MPLLHAQLTGNIIGAYYAVYNGLSHVYPEYVYEKAMMYELKQRGIPCVRQDDYAIWYKEILVGRQILDLFVADQVVVELKAQPELTRLHAAQTMSYIKTTGNQVGLLFNFGGATPEFKRIYFSTERQTPTNPANVPRQEQLDLLYPELSHEIISVLFEVHNTLGPGFMRRIYAKAVYREMQLREMAVTPYERIMVTYKEHPLAEVPFQHLVVEESIMVFPVAIDDISKIKLESLRLWMAAQGIQLGILANFHAVRLELHFMVQTTPRYANASPH